jgi:hypothetical protein
VRGYPGGPDGVEVVLGVCVVRAQATPQRVEDRGACALLVYQRRGLGMQPPQRHLTISTSIEFRVSRGGPRAADAWVPVRGEVRALRTRGECGCLGSTGSHETTPVLRRVQAFARLRTSSSISDCSPGAGCANTTAIGRVGRGNEEL